MADNANIRAWGQGVVYVAPVGTTGPTDVTTPLGASWDDLGELDQDAGADLTISEDTTDVYAWGKGLARRIKSKHKREIKVVVLETNAVVLGLVNPGSTATNDGTITTYVVKQPTADPRAFVIHEVDGDVIRRRIIKRAEVSAVGEAIKDGETGVTQWPLTIAIYPDASTSEIWTEITNDPAYLDIASA